MGIAGSSDLSAIESKIVVMSEREKLIDAHVLAVEQNLLANHEILRDLTISEAANFHSLVNKLRQLTIATSVDHLLFLIDECHGHICDHKSTLLSCSVVLWRPIQHSYLS